jgi:hypothetical protein
MVCLGVQVLTGHSWIKLSDGHWDRYMVRHCHSCKKSHVIRLVWVDPSFAFCPACLSHRVRANFLDDYVYINCLECLARSAVERDDEEDEY